MQTPSFSHFSDLIDFWDHYLAEEELTNKINTVLDNCSFVLFFEKDDTVFGATEDSRVIFARMKSPDEENTDDWANEATFVAYNIIKIAKGEGSQHLFDKENIKKIKILDREDAVKKVEKEAKKLGDAAFSKNTEVINIAFLNRSSEDIPNFDTTEEV